MNKTSDKKVAELAELFARARRERRTLEALTPAQLPGSMSEVYRIQDRLIDLLGEPVAGWFCGATSEEIRRKIGLATPYCARILANALYPSPARLDPRDYPVLAWECEFGFRLARDLAPRERPYDESEVAAAVESVHPVLEVVTSRFDNWREQPVFARLADNGGEGAIVWGAAVHDWRRHNLADVRVELRLDDRIAASGTGSAALGHPLKAMTWLVNAVNARGVTLPAGACCSTGTVTGMTLGTHAEVAVADFGPLGQVRGSFADR
jgi:2-keto-4-pentenoate hydratase